MTYTLDDIRRMVFRISQGACDATEMVNRITGASSTDFQFAAIYEDDCCAIAVAFDIDPTDNNQAIAAKIKAPIQCNGMTNPVLMVESDGTVIRHHGETVALVKHLNDLYQALEGKLY